MARSVWKGPFFIEKNYKNLNKKTLKKKKVFLIKKKNNIIIPEFLNSIVKLYNGKKFVELLITSEMLSHKFGEFIFTRKLHVYKSKK